VDTLTLALLATLSPLPAFFIALVFLRSQPRLAQLVALAGTALTLVGSAGLLAQGPVEPLRFLWFSSGQINLQFGFLFDGISLVFGVAVSLITLCVMVYSLSYMAHDPSKSRYFAMLSLFAWAMLSFVYAVDLLQAFIFWELVGLASFFLIGFWYEKPEASAAARKAFLMTRIGDVGLFIGILMILPLTSNFDLPTLLNAETGLVKLAAPAALSTITLLIFMGIVGKSAQFPLHTWLPDAMEGPTPVSALLHSATMVAAGVYLMARLHPLFMAAPDTLYIILCIAAFTALLAATIAMVERDIKKVFAYSSISQLGFMLMGLAAGSLFAGVFHLITHAVFKALLFLCSGVYIHHFETNDLEEIGRRGGRRLRATTLALAIGAGALAGVPPLAGFFSKEEIFAALGHDGATLFSIVALFAAFLTAYYTARMLFLVILPAKIEEDTQHDAQHGPAQPIAMLAPILLLALGALSLGFVGTRLAVMLGVAPAHHEIASMLPAIGVVLLGILIAYMDYGRRGAARKGFIASVPVLQKLFENRWYIDEFYRTVFVRLNDALSALFYAIEQRFFDAGFDEFGSSALKAGNSASRLQSGWVQIYAGATVVLIGLAALYIGLR
jgi:NADH-quinone oxidoreductase subunit L